MAAVSKLVLHLQISNLHNQRAKSAIVSGGYFKYSHFWETATGDPVRSTLRGRCGSLLVEQIPLSAKTGFTYLGLTAKRGLVMT